MSLSPNLPVSRRSDDRLERFQGATLVPVGRSNSHSTSAAECVSLHAPSVRPSALVATATGGGAVIKLAFMFTIW
jgi:hypothetical protein